MRSAGGGGAEAQAADELFRYRLTRELAVCSSFYEQMAQTLSVRLGRLRVGHEQLVCMRAAHVSHDTIKQTSALLAAACAKFCRDSLLLEDFALLNWSSARKLLKKRDRQMLPAAPISDSYMKSSHELKPLVQIDFIEQLIAAAEELYGEAAASGEVPAPTASASVLASPAPAAAATRSGGADEHHCEEWEELPGFRQSLMQSLIHPAVESHCESRAPHPHRDSSSGGGKRKLTSDGKTPFADRNIKLARR
jgi:hypothetical protein